MSQIIRIDAAEIIPDEEAVLRAQGLRRGEPVDGRIRSLLEDTMAILAKEARPVSIVEEVSIEVFETVFHGEGRNADETLLGEVYPRSHGLALFALTVGEAVSTRIGELFEEREFALGAMLDAVASEAADRAVGACERWFLNLLAGRSPASPDDRVLGYSPGYCGWDISGQKKLFQALRPERIGITLNESCLMHPLKSVSGVLVGGLREIHVVDPDYPFCRFCRTHSCRQRMKSLE